MYIYGREENMNYNNYLERANDTLSIERANDIFVRIHNSINDTDEDAKELYEDFLDGAFKYASIRSLWLTMSKDEKMERDKERTLKHDSVINRINILARYLEKSGNDISWRTELGDSRKRIGDFACYIALFYGLEAR